MCKYSEQIFEKGSVERIDLMMARYLKIHYDTNQLKSKTTESMMTRLMFELLVLLETLYLSLSQ